MESDEDVAAVGSESSAVRIARCGFKRLQWHGAARALRGKLNGAVAISFIKLGGKNNFALYFWCCAWLIGSKRPDLIRGLRGHNRLHCWCCVPSHGTNRASVGIPHTQSAFSFASLPLFAVSFNGARPYLWFFTATKSFSNLVNLLEKKIDETEKRYEESSRVGEERLKRALDAESKVIQLRTIICKGIFLVSELNFRSSQKFQGAQRRSQPKIKRRVSKYEVRRTIGDRTFAKVKFEMSSQTGDPVALKILDEEKVLKHKMAEQIRREIATMKLIQRPNVVRIYEVSL
ncbi:CBL-interacting serine/threonine-protein kinase 3 [Stylosanthes scabra]|uniref:CBL-interacting serine/threonine-protein kinase 3 n=1 Tax=Stylosanthes scabra TaxID=79078 RepID=A0ABU6XFY3_9FABA|nr:CBL-interacting serine/threonine-protein kinase 3 [Stylosanthes scabra]